MQANSLKKGVLFVSGLGLKCRELLHICNHIHIVAVGLGGRQHAQAPAQASMTHARAACYRLPAALCQGTCAQTVGGGATHSPVDGIYTR